MVFGANLRPLRISGSRPLRRVLSDGLSALRHMQVIACLRSLLPCFGPGRRGTHLIGRISSGPRRVGTQEANTRVALEARVARFGEVRDAVSCDRIDIA